MLLKSSCPSSPNQLFWRDRNTPQPEGDCCRVQQPSTEYGYISSCNVHAGMVMADRTYSTKNFAKQQARSAKMMRKKAANLQKASKLKGKAAKLRSKAAKIREGLRKVEEKAGKIEMKAAQFEGRH